MSYLVCESVVVIQTKIMTTTNVNDEQLELGLNPLQARIYGRKREVRVARAKWWFAKMRAAVGQAMDWQPSGQARPEQVWMPAANRQ